MTTIRIADDPHPSQRIRANTFASASGVDVNDGVYSMRALSRATSMDRRSRASSKDRRTTTGLSEKEVEDEDPGLRRQGDYKEKQVFTGTLLMWLAYQSIGVIYGDIGTSPLYVFSSTFKSPPKHDDLVGVLSTVLWSVTMMVTVKYVLIILHADNDGEGGTFSTYSLLSRYLNITNRDPRESSLIEMRRYKSGDLESVGRHMRHGLEKSKFAKTVLKVIGVLAVSMVMSDGILTPAQSVLGAVQGLEVVTPDISKSVVVGVTDAILILLFLIQPFGLTKLASTFAPIVIIWLGFNFSFGIYNLVKYDYTVLKAFNPGYAFEYLIRHKEEGWRSLGGVLLAFTGVEALFADLGAFSRRAIQLSWLCYTYPCLLLAYIGQAAYISHDPSAYTNPFYNAVPPGMLYPSLVVAILAAVVASQAIITATFQLMAQIMKLSYFPQIKVVHTSKTFHGQLYVPLVNWLLMIGTVLIASIYNNTTSLGNAYGVCVIFVTFFDTCMVSLAAIFVWRIRPYYVFLPWLTIACLDATFLSSALTKVPDGAWFTITLACVLAAAFILWRFGKEQQWAAEAEDRFPTSHFVKEREDGQLQLTKKYGGGVMGSIRGFGIFFDKAGETTPIVFSQFISKLVAAPEVMVFFHLRPLEKPSVPAEERYHVSHLAIPHCYRVVLRHGYLDEVITPDLAKIIYEQVKIFIIARTNDPAQQQAEPRRPVKIIQESETTDSSNNETTVPLSSVNTQGSNTVPLSSTNTQGSNPAANTISFQLPNPPTRTSSNSKVSPEADGQAIEPETRDHDDPASSKDPSSLAAASELTPQSLELSKLDSAFNHQVLYIIGKEQMKIKPNPKAVQDPENANLTEGGDGPADIGDLATATNRMSAGFWHVIWLDIRTGYFFRRALLNVFLWVRENTRTKIANLRVPVDRVFEVGFIKEV